MFPNAKPSELAAVLATLNPVSQSAATVTTGWISAKDFFSFAALIQTGSLGTSATVDAKLQQATDSSGTSAKDITGKAITQIVKATGDNKQAIINLRPQELDVNGGFSYFRLSFGVPPHSILLPRSPLIRLVGVHYLDMTGQSQTVPEDLYILDAVFEPARITPKFGKIWPIPLPQVGSVWVDFEAGYVTPVFVDTAANTVTLAGWKPLAVGDAVRLSNSGGLLPAPLKPDRNYFVAAVVSESVYQLADTPAGAAIDLRADGTGTHYLGQPGAGGNEGKIPANILAWMLLRAGSLYEHRTETAITKGAVTPLPYAEHLLDPYRLRTV